MNNFELTALRQTRENTISVLNSLRLEQINAIPEGYSNSIGWNAAHMLVTQQLLCYKLSGNEMRLSSEYVDQFRKGTKHEKDLSQEEVEELKSQLISSIDQFIQDLDQLNFENFNEYSTSYGTTLTSIQDAFSFNNLHEGLHFGYILAMKHLV